MFQFLCYWLSHCCATKKFKKIIQKRLMFLRYVFLSGLNEEKTKLWDAMDLSWWFEMESPCTQLYDSTRKTLESVKPFRKLSAFQKLAWTVKHSFRVLQFKACQLTSLLMLDFIPLKHDSETAWKECWDSLRLFLSS